MRGSITGVTADPPWAQRKIRITAKQQRSYGLARTEWKWQRSLKTAAALPTGPIFQPFSSPAKSNTELKKKKIAA
jgi:hypothetical protein